MMLSFIYGGPLYVNYPHDFNISTLIDILTATDVFEEYQLRGFLIREIEPLINVGNVVETYLLASRAVPILEEVMEVCDEYMLNNLPEVAKTTSFPNLPMNRIVDLVSQYAKNNCDLNNYFV